MHGACVGLCGIGDRGERAGPGTSGWRAGAGCGAGCADPLVKVEIDEHNRHHRSSKKEYPQQQEVVLNYGADSE